MWPGGPDGRQAAHSPSALRRLASWALMGVRGLGKTRAPLLVKCHPGKHGRHSPGPLPLTRAQSRPWQPRRAPPRPSRQGHILRLQAPALRTRQASASEAGQQARASRILCFRAGGLGLGAGSRAPPKLPPAPRLAESAQGPRPHSSRSRSFPRPDSEPPFPSHKTHQHRRERPRRLYFHVHFGSWSLKRGKAHRRWHQPPPPLLPQPGTSKCPPRWGQAPGGPQRHHKAAFCP